jgi:hypothetical protein
MGAPVKAPAAIADASGNFDLSGKNIDYFMAYTGGVDRFLKGKKADEKAEFLKEYEAVVPAIRNLESGKKELVTLYKTTFNTAGSDTEQATLARNFYGALAQGDEEGAKKILIKKLTSKEQQGAVSDADEFVRNVADLKQALAKIKPGLVTGSLEAIANMAGKSSDPDVSEAAAIARNLTDILQRARSGAAAPESEVKRFASLMGRISTSDTLNDATLNATLKAVANAKRSAFGSVLTDKQYSDLIEKAGDIGKYLEIARTPTDTLRKNKGSVSGTGGTYQVKDITGATETVTGEEFAAQFNKELAAASTPESKATIIKNVKAYAAAAGIPVEVYDPMGIF